MPRMITPLQRAVGFHVSEHTYDKLGELEQIIVDLRIEGYTNVDIAGLLGVRPVDIKHSMEIIRTKLAKSELHYHLQMRLYYKENREMVLDDTAFADGFGFQHMLGSEL